MDRSRLEAFPILSGLGPDDLGRRTATVVAAASTALIAVVKRDVWALERLAAQTS